MVGWEKMGKKRELPETETAALGNEAGMIGTASLL